MKQLEFAKMEELQGGIACSQLNKVLSIVAERNPGQLNAILNTFAIFGHGGAYTLQCS